MKHVLSDKYSIAWFKLAQCISKGERERAMGIYRLLSHSIDNSAFAKQLEADIYLYFQDTVTALQKYKEAAAMYRAQNEFVQALAVYEHYLLIDDNAHDIQCLFYEVAQQVGDAKRMMTVATALIQDHVQDKRISEAQAIFDHILQYSPPVEWIVQSGVKLLHAHALYGSDESVVQPLIIRIFDLLTTSYQPYDLHVVVSQFESQVPKYQMLVRAYLHGN